MWWLFKFKKVLNGPGVKALQKPKSGKKSIIIRIHEIFVFFKDLAPNINLTALNVFIPLVIHYLRLICSLYC